MTINDLKDGESAIIKSLKEEQELKDRFINFVIEKYKPIKKLDNT